MSDGMTEALREDTIADALQRKTLDDLTTAEWDAANRKFLIGVAGGAESATAKHYRELRKSSADRNSAPGFLRRAVEIMEERGKQYDKPEGERSMLATVTAFNTITGHNLSEAEGWLLLQILKDVRQWQRPGFHLDSAEDCVAYAALKAEAKSREPS